MAVGARQVARLRRAGRRQRPVAARCAAVAVRARRRARALMGPVTPRAPRPASRHCAAGSRASSAADSRSRRTARACARRQPQRHGDGGFVLAAAVVARRAVALALDLQRRRLRRSSARRPLAARRLRGAAQRACCSGWRAHAASKPCLRDAACRVRIRQASRLPPGAGNIPGASSRHGNLVAMAGASAREVHEPDEGRRTPAPKKDRLVSRQPTRVNGGLRSASTVRSGQEARRAWWRRRPRLRLDDRSGNHRGPNAVADAAIGVEAARQRACSVFACAKRHPDARARGGRNAWPFPSSSCAQMLAAAAQDHWSGSRTSAR